MDRFIAMLNNQRVPRTPLKKTRSSFRGGRLCRTWDDMGRPAKSDQPILDAEETQRK